MKKFTKGCLITALVLVLLGGSICIVGVITGGFRLINGEAGERDDHFLARLAAGAMYGAEHGWEEGWYDGWRETWADTEEAREDWWEEAREDWEDAYDDPEDKKEDYRDKEFWANRYDWPTHSVYASAEAAGKGETISSEEYVDIKAGASEISGLDMDIGAAALYLKESDNDSFGIKKSGTGEYRYYIANGTLYIEGIKKNARNHDPEVYVYIPADMKFDNVSLDIGAGTFELGDLSADQLEIDLGAGEIALDGVVASELKISVGAGKVWVNGSVSDKIEVECNIGEVSLTLAGSAQDYNYKMEGTAGSITVDGRTYMKLAGEKYIDNNAPGKCELECVMGSIRMDFEQ